MPPAPGNELAESLQCWAELFPAGGVVTSICGGHIETPFFSIPWYLFAMTPHPDLHSGFYLNSRDVTAPHVPGAMKVCGELRSSLNVALMAPLKP